MEARKIKFRDPEDDTMEVEVYTDATTSQLGWCDIEGGGHASTIDLPIIYAETLAALIGVYKHIYYNHKNINLFTDNMATLYFFKKGTAGFLYNLSFYCHFLFCSIVCKAKRLANVKVAYINTSVNPADEWSRV